AHSVTLTVTSGDLGADDSKLISAKFTDTAGNTSTTTALPITLDISADLGAPLTLSITDTTINNAEKTAVAFTVSGIDPDVAGADATVTFSDGTNHVTRSEEHTSDHQSR